MTTVEGDNRTDCPSLDEARGDNQQTCAVIEFPAIPAELNRVRRGDNRTYLTLSIIGIDPPIFGGVF
jgi:hypothetical protein